MSTKRDYQPGEQIPGTIYKVVRSIGAGGMGTVYDVEDTTIGKRYVLKTLHPELGSRQDLARRMQAEARTLARLNHPNIVEVMTAGVTSDEVRLPFYVMERLNGQNLRVVLQKKGSLELPHVYHIAIDLLDALDHAHDKGVIHRDVKPDNIFLHRMSSGVTVTKLLDFGIMTLLDGGAGETAGRFLGTLRYAAPEQLRGEKPTPRMDLYAAALVLYEMIAGRGPFDDEADPSRVAAARLHKPPPPLSRFAAIPVPAELESLVRAALADDPQRRPKDAFSFAAQLRNLKRSMHAGEIDSTANRSTVNAVLDPESERPRPAIVKLHPNMAMTPLATASNAPVSTAKTTMLGMAPPTISGATLENAAASAVARSTPSAAPPGAAWGARPPIDRAAVTHTMLPDTPRSPQDGTDPMMVSGMPPPRTLQSPVALQQAPAQPAPPPHAAAPPTTAWRPSQPPPSTRPTPQFQWPPERPNERSEGAQVHSVSAGPPRARAKGPAIAFAVALVIGALGAGIYLMTLKRATPGPAAAPTELPTASPVVTVAPTLAPPAFDESPTRASETPSRAEMGGESASVGQEPRKSASAAASSAPPTASSVPAPGAPPRTKRAGF